MAYIQLQLHPHTIRIDHDYLQAVLVLVQNVMSLTGGTVQMQISRS